MQIPNEKEKEFYETLPLTRKTILKEAFCKHFGLKKRTFFDRLKSRPFSQQEKDFFEHFQKKAALALEEVEMFPKEEGKEGEAA